MAKFPALSLWTDSWIADTHHLSRTERGTYLDLLVLMWRNPKCRVPNDDAWLAKRLNMTPEEVQNELRPLIQEFCKTDGNYIWQKRLLIEFERAVQHASNQSVRAKAMWNKKKKNAQTDATSGIDPAMLPLPLTSYLLPTKEEEEQPTSSAVPLRYAYENGAIRLNEKDYKRWEEAFPNLHLPGELEALADWAGKQQNWFNAVAGALVKRNRLAMLAKEQAKMEAEIKATPKVNRSAIL